MMGLTHAQCLEKHPSVPQLLQARPACSASAPNGGRDSHSQLAALFHTTHLYVTTGVRCFYKSGVAARAPGPPKLATGRQTASERVCYAAGCISRRHISQAKSQRDNTLVSAARGFAAAHMPATGAGRITKRETWWPPSPLMPASRLSRHAGQRPAFPTPMTPPDHPRDPSSCPAAATLLLHGHQLLCRARIPTHARLDSTEPQTQRSRQGAWDSLSTWAAQAMLSGAHAPLEARGSMQVTALLVHSRSDMSTPSSIRFLIPVVARRAPSHWPLEA